MNRLLLLASSLLVLSACNLPDAQAPSRPLPSYAGHAIELFDDGIEPKAVGISLDVKSDPRSDRKLQERVQTGDAVVRVRITTVTAKQADNGTGYLVGVKKMDVLAGHFPPPESFDLNVGALGPSAGLFKNLEGQLVGKTFIAFVRSFIRPDGDQEMHFHFAPDSKQEAEAVADAITLSAL